MDDELAAVADALVAADVAAALTGAGVSAASGVPTFRGEDGVWGSAFDPMDFELDRFEDDPVGFWCDRLCLHEAMFGGDVAPNAAHEALARLERLGVLDAVITQNTDGLHAAAGSERVVELHGNATRVVCRGCDRRADAGAAYDRVREGERPPTCGECGDVYKPDVVLFGESLPDDAFAAALGLASESDVFLAVGSSLLVEPAASLPLSAAESGTVVVVNLESTPASGIADVDLRADATAALPRLVDLVADRR